MTKLRNVLSIVLAILAASTFNASAQTAAGSVQPIWWLAAAITLMFRSGKIGHADQWKQDS